MGIDDASSTTSDISLSRSSSSISLGGSNQNQNVGNLNGSPVAHTQSSVNNSHHQQSSVASKVKGFFEKIGHIAASPFNSLMGKLTLHNTPKKADEITARRLDAEDASAPRNWVGSAKTEDLATLYKVIQKEVKSPETFLRSDSPQTRIITDYQDVGEELGLILLDLVSEEAPMLTGNVLNIDTAAKLLGDFFAEVIRTPLPQSLKDVLATAVAAIEDSNLDEEGTQKLKDTLVKNVFLRAICPGVVTVSFDAAAGPHEGLSLKKLSGFIQSVVNGSAWGPEQRAVHGALGEAEISEIQASSFDWLMTAASEGTAYRPESRVEVVEREKLENFNDRRKYARMGEPSRAPVIKGARSTNANEEAIKADLRKWHERDASDEVKRALDAPWRPSEMHRNGQIVYSHTLRQREITGGAVGIKKVEEGLQALNLNYEKTSHETNDSTVYNLHVVGRDRERLINIRDAIKPVVVFR